MLRVQVRPEVAPVSAAQSLYDAALLFWYLSIRVLRFAKLADLRLWFTSVARIIVAMLVWLSTKP